MEASLLEIIELANGDVVLQRVNGEGEPLINIRFSRESEAYIPGMRLEIAKAMIQAGVQTFSEMAAEREYTAEYAEVDRTVH